MSVPTYCIECNTDESKVVKLWAETGQECSRESIFLSDQNVCALSSSVLTALSHKSSLPLLRAHEAWNRLAGMWMSRWGCPSVHFLIHTDWVMDWETLSVSFRLDQHKVAGDYHRCDIDMCSKCHCLDVNVSVQSDVTRLSPLPITGWKSSTDSASGAWLVSL